MDGEMSRPLWPYGKWTDTCLCRIDENEQRPDNLSACKKCDQKHTTLKCSERDSLNGLKTFLQVFDKDLEVYETENAEGVQNEINYIIENAARFLPGKLIKTGSVVDGTKVGKMDEFDYLFVVKRPKEDLENKKFYVDYMHMVLTCIQRHLRHTQSDWKILDFEDLMERVRGSHGGIATTVHLQSQRFKMDVDIDMCVCLYLRECDIKPSEGKIKAEGSKVLNGEYLLVTIKSIVHSYPGIKVFAIIRNDHISGSFRITIPSLEASRFLLCGRHSGQVKTYRYAKCIAKYFFPKVHVYEQGNEKKSCSRCSHCIVKSYHLKNIMLFMMQNHKDPSLWSDDNVPNRLIEVFDILATCLENSPGNSFAPTVATFCIPGSLVLKHYFKSHSEENIHTRGSCVTYKLSFSPTYSEKMKTGGTSIDEIVEKYFSFSANNDWDSHTLILNVRNILHELKQLNVPDMQGCDV